MTANTAKRTVFFSVPVLARVGILSAVAFVLMMFEFPLPIAPSFYKLDFSEVAVLMGGFAMGPVAAAGSAGDRGPADLVCRASCLHGSKPAVCRTGTGMAVGADICHHDTDHRRSLCIIR